MLAGGVAYYWFILRRWNSLGFRMFSLFAFVAILFGTWIYRDVRVQKSALANGREITGKILAKGHVYQGQAITEEEVSRNHSSSVNNALTVQVALPGAEPGSRDTWDYISSAEWNRFRVGEVIPLIHDAKTDRLLVKESFQRMIADFWVLYAADAFFLLTGIGCWIVLRKHKVGVDEHGNEWVEKPDGSVILDERKSVGSRVLKKANILSKLWQTIGK